MYDVVLTFVTRRLDNGPSDSALFHDEDSRTSTTSPAATVRSAPSSGAFDSSVLAELPGFDDVGLAGLLIRRCSYWLLAQLTRTKSGL